MRLLFRLFILLCFITLIFSAIVNGQDVELAPSENISTSKADSLFNSENYSLAIIEYLKLLDNYPQEPDYHYKIGISYLNSTRNISKALEHLTFASTREVSNLVYYYLGLAHQKYYRFDQAISYYRRFVINGGDIKVTNEQIERLVSQCENGIFMLEYVYEPKVIDRKRIPFNQFHNFIVTKSDLGSFIPMPNDLKTPTDIKQGDSNVIFYPNNPKPGDRIIYSSYGSTTSFGKDLYVIEMLKDGFWSKPKDLGDDINTNLNEDFAYLAPDGVTLYFASNGHYSMGGYDVYRSVYNPNLLKWSTPENIGYPFSSPFDDYLFVPNENGDMAILVTNRNVLSDSVDVVLVNIDPNPIRRFVDSHETILRISSFTPDIKIGANSTGLIGGSGISTAAKQQSTKAASFSAVENDPEYSRALAQGFAEQMKADSLRIRLETLRARFDYINTAEERKALEIKVVAVEDALLEAQRNADIHFGQASQIEQEFLTGKRKATDKTTATFASDKPEYLYQAQFAPTVFQADELNKLAQLEKTTPQIEKLRDDVLSLKGKVVKLDMAKSDSTSNESEYNILYNKYISSLKSFNNLISTQIVGKKKLYNDCISVALMKSGTNNNQEIRGEIDRAKSHFRSAMAIRNNISDESKVESEYEAFLLEELGILRLEIAFAKLWGMRLFEQQLLSKIYKLEQNIFGKTLPNIPAKQTSSQPEIKEQIPQGHISITRVDTVPISAEEFTFQLDKDPSFQVLEKSPYDGNNPIPPHEPLPPGVVYKIQLAAFSNPVKIDFFKGMVPLSAEPINNGKVTKYYAGNFTNLAEAESALPIVRSKGFKDAFVVAWHNGRSVPPSRAKSLENSTESNQKQDPVKIDIIPDDKLYVIQLGAYTGRIPDDVIQTIRALAPAKDIVRKPDGKGGFIYSVGSYTDANEATRIKDNLVASGIKNAFVVAVEVDN